MEPYPNNSHRAKDGDEPEDDAPARTPKFEKVITSKAVQRKKPLLSRFAETFIGDKPENVLEYIFRDVLVPAAKDAITSAISEGIEKLFFGEGSSRHRRGSSSTSRYNNSPYTPYNRMSERSSSRRREEPRERERSRHRPSTSIRDLEEVVIDTRAEADSVLEMMYNALEQYEEVTVLDYYDMVGIKSNFTDETWGWTDLGGTQIRRVRGGAYILTLPEPQQLN
jgi:hypothetical protein